ELPQLPQHDTVILDRIPIQVLRHVNQLEQEARAFNVLEESGAQPAPLVSTFDQPGNVRYHKAALRIEGHHPEMRLQGSERMIRVFRRGRIKPGDQGRLPDVGKSHQPDIGQELKIQPQDAFLARRARSSASRSLVSRGRKTSVSFATPSPFRREESL